MKNYRYHLRDKEGNTVMTSMTLNTAKRWLRTKKSEESVWDSRAERQLLSISPDLKTVVVFVGGKEICFERDVSNYPFFPF